MKSIPDTQNIISLNIPGAHDASTKYCQLGLFSSCQKLTVKEMMNIGVRAFDLRVDGENMVHSFTKCKKTRFGKNLTIYDVTNDILEFLKDNPTETVIVFFKNDGKTSSRDCLDLLVKNIIKKIPEMWFLENRLPFLSEIRGKIILINRIDSSTGIDFSKMPYQGGTKDTHAEDFSSDGIGTVTVQDRYVLTRKRKWQEAVKPVLENENQYVNKLVLNHLSTAGMPFIPRFNSAYINRRFLSFRLKSKGHYGIIMADFQSSEIADKIIKSNF